MRKNATDYVMLLPVDYRGETLNPNSSLIPDSILTKLAEKERVEMKSKSFPKRRWISN
jgi:hypothetical protein